MTRWRNRWWLSIRARNVSTSQSRRSHALPGWSDPARSLSYPAGVLPGSVQPCCAQSGTCVHRRLQIAQWYYLLTMCREGHKVRARQLLFGPLEYNRRFRGSAGCRLCPTSASLSGIHQVHRPCLRALAPDSGVFESLISARHGSASTILFSCHASEAE